MSVLDEVPQLIAEREQRLRDLGPRPPWYRPFARRRWKTERARISAMDVSILAWMLRQHYTPEMVVAMAERRNPMLATMKMERTGYHIDPWWTGHHPKDKS